MILTLVSSCYTMLAFVRTSISAINYFLCCCPSCGLQALVEERHHHSMNLGPRLSKLLHGGGVSSQGAVFFLNMGHIPIAIRHQGIYESWGLITYHAPKLNLNAYPNHYVTTVGGYAIPSNSGYMVILNLHSVFVVALG